jgi:protein phosphatase
LSTSEVRYAVAAVSDCGSKRPSNEDAFGISAEHGVYVLCDGMGGAAAGEVASALAADVVVRLLSSRAAAESAAAPLEDVVKEGIRSANEIIHSRAQRDPELHGMGTTLVGLVTEGPRVLVFNVGDSRCYRMRNSTLIQISQDHSLVEEQVRMGRITHAEALRSPLRNVITRALGTESSVEPDLLTGELPDPLIESMLAADLSLNELCTRLVDAANRAGGHDNITCLLVRAES